MRQTSLVLVGLVMAWTLGLADVGTAQPGPPTIHRVTLQPDTGVLTITGTGLGPDLQVTVDGQPVPQLPGATDAQMDVLAPVTVLTMPGTYRLTVVDPMRRVGDAFVVAHPMGSVVTAGGALPTGVPPSGPLAVATRATAPALNGRAGNTASRLRTSHSPLAVIEDANAPYKTAIGWQALSSNTTGSANTASGYQALLSNTNGTYNVASGAYAMASNTTGSLNTASGYLALFSNITGDSNTATGQSALRSNATGNFNTATGRSALDNNTAGSTNTASGYGALLSNTTGNSNTALGFKAGFNATTGSYNVVIGADVVGLAADTNTIRIGLPYNSGTGAGQNQTFIAGIRGTQLTGSAVQVFIDANGQLGTLTPPVASGTGTTSPAWSTGPGAIQVLDAGNLSVGR